MDLSEVNKGLDEVINLTPLPPSEIPPGVEVAVADEPGNCNPPPRVPEGETAELDGSFNPPSPNTRPLEAEEVVEEEDEVAMDEGSFNPPSPNTRPLEAEEMVVEEDELVAVEE